MRIIIPVVCVVIVESIKMSWEKIVKRLQPKSAMHGFAFRTPVDYEDEGKAIVEWEFTFGQRETYMREIGVYVTDITLPDGTKLEQDEIEKINIDSPDIYGKLGPSELVKYSDSYDLIWSQ